MIIELYDITGKLMMTLNCQDDMAAIDMSRFRKGVYVLRISDGTSIVLRRIDRQ